MKIAALALMIATVAACSSTPRVTHALHDWRQGRRGAAIETAKEELERFRRGNRLSQAEVEASLTEVARIFDDERPLVVEGQAPPVMPSDEARPKHGIHHELRSDLASDGTTRVLRAVRAVERLQLAAFAPDLFAIIWNRWPYMIDGPLLADRPTALRSVAVKLAALRALSAIR